MILLEYKNIKIFLKKGYIANWSEDVFVVKRVKNTVSWTYVINDLNAEEIVEHFTKSNWKKKSKRV